ncbi:MAG: type II toxin-antitoxin system VapC family toxin [Leptospiraceae bacterium]|nr:type II toxin-antitoxin system VapC family toxin [Leptospiraceae bacterium]
MTSVYLDTSALIRWVLQSPNYYPDFGNWDVAVTSTLLRAEFRRTMDRLLKRSVLTEVQVEKCYEYLEDISPYINWIKLDERILEKAGDTYNYPIGTLDAIHLVSSYLYKEEFEVGKYYLLTHDEELTKAANSLGIQTKGI